jgi:hypothetical protein
VGAAPREGAAVEMGLAVVAQCGSAVRQRRGGDGSVVRRDQRGAIYSRSKAVRRRYFQRGGSPAKAVLWRGRGGWPESQSSGDGTARAEAN